ncbi:hypothetical protein BD410DRAFT_844808 [Rickenella mellea]|uniref:Uncharacterized protein n=1 Tax=Rickenella mellea TaxID=50990 RepID=A0A4Y7PKB0_9AGAM|nr:hypothetical protein BD410DRAFT_844808 [Rickenella mellea]
MPREAKFEAIQQRIEHLKTRKKPDRITTRRLARLEESSRRALTREVKLLRRIVHVGDGEQRKAVGLRAFGSKRARMAVKIMNNDGGDAPMAEDAGHPAESSEMHGDLGEAPTSGGSGAVDSNELPERTGFLGRTVAVITGYFVTPQPRLAGTLGSMHAPRDLVENALNGGSPREPSSDQPSSDGEAAATTEADMQVVLYRPPAGDEADASLGAHESTGTNEVPPLHGDVEMAAEEWLGFQCDSDSALPSQDVHITDGTATGSGNENAPGIGVRLMEGMDVDAGDADAEDIDGNDREEDEDSDVDEDGDGDGDEEADDKNEEEEGGQMPVNDETLKELGAGSDLALLKASIKRLEQLQKLFLQQQQQQQTSNDSPKPPKGKKKGWKECEFRRKVREHLAELMDREGEDLPAPPSKTDKVIFKEVKKHGPTEENWSYAYDEIPRHAWNIAAERVFVKTFMEYYPREDRSKGEVEGAFRSHMRYIRELYFAQLKRKPAEEKLNKMKKKRRARRHTLLQHRSDAAKRKLGRKGLEHLVKVVEDLGVDGMSEDETDGEENQRTGARNYRVTDPVWRSKRGDFRGFLRTLDLLYTSTKYRPEDFQPVRGCWTRMRMAGEAEAPQFTSAVPHGLPKNCYDRDWLKALDPDDRDALNVQKAIDFRIPKDIVKFASRYVRCYTRDDRPALPDVVAQETQDIRKPEEDRTGSTNRMTPSNERKLAKREEKKRQQMEEMKKHDEAVKMAAESMENSGGGGKRRRRGGRGTKARKEGEGETDDDSE